MSLFLSLAVFTLSAEERDVFKTVARRYRIGDAEDVEMQKRGNMKSLEGKSLEDRESRESRENERHEESKSLEEDS